MALFEKIRSQTDSTAARIFFILIVLVFVFWGVGAANGPKAQTYANVNGKRITDSEVNQLARQMANRAGSTMNADEEESIRRAALEQLILTEALYQEALKMGLEVSSAEMAFMLFQDEVFLDNGEFSDERYEDDLKRRGFASPAKYEESLRRSIALDKLMQIASKSVYFSDKSLKQQFNHEYAQIKLSWVMVPESALLDDVEISNDAIAAELESQAEALQETYDRLKASKYDLPDRVKYQMASIAIDTENLDAAEQAANKLVENLKADTTLAFDTAATGLGFMVDSTSDFRSQNQLNSKIPSDSDAAKSIMALNPNDLYGPVKLENEWYVLKLTEKDPAKTITFEEAKQELAKNSLQEKGVSEKAKSYVDSVLSSWKEKGDADTALLAEQDLKVQSAGPFNRNKAADSLKDLGNSPLLLDAVSTISKAGVLSEAFPTIGGYIVAKVESVGKPVEKFEKVKTDLKAQLLLKFMDQYIQSVKGATVIDNRLTAQTQ